MKGTAAGCALFAVCLYLSILAGGWSPDNAFLTIVLLLVAGCACTLVGEWVNRRA